MQRRQVLAIAVPGALMLARRALTRESPSRSPASAAESSSPACSAARTS